MRKSLSGMGLFLALLAAGIGITAALAAQNAQAGEKIDIMDDYSHIPEGVDPNPYNSNPPTSGLHYEEDLQAGFYAENVYDNPEGYLVHNLEHGYIIFWYNCSILDEMECRDLTEQIRDVMDERDNFKLIAYPWEKIDTVLVLTSWGRRLAMDSFDREEALDFIDRNINKAPEPHAD